MIIWLLLLLFIGALYVLIKKGIIKSTFKELSVKFLTLIILLVGFFYALKTFSSAKCDRDSAEKFAVKRMTGMAEIISGPDLKSENDNCTFTFTARTKMEPRWDPMQQRNRVAILDNEITVSMRKGKWEVLDIESSYIRDY